MIHDSWERRVLIFPSSTETTSFKTTVERDHGQHVPPSHDTTVLSLPSHIPDQTYERAGAASRSYDWQMIAYSTFDQPAATRMMPDSAGEFGVFAVVPEFPAHVDEYGNNIRRRKPHAKSRTGCKACKQRRIKASRTLSACSDCS